MSSTTTTSAKAGNAYSHRPSWATEDPDVQPTYLQWFGDVAVGDSVSIGRGRRDGLVGDTFSDIGEAYVYLREVEDRDRTPAEARELAALLIQAAELAEQG